MFKNLKPDLNLVNNMSLSFGVSTCEFLESMPFNELINAIMSDTYGTIAYDPKSYTEDEVIIIQMIANRGFTNLVTVGNMPCRVDFPFEDEDLPFGVDDCFVSFEKEDFISQEELEEKYPSKFNSRSFVLFQNGGFLHPFISANEQIYYTKPEVDELLSMLNLNNSESYPFSECVDSRDEVLAHRIQKKRK